MKLARTLVAAAAVSLLGLGLSAAPAQAMDSSWGCGGFCRVAGR